MKSLFFIFSALTLTAVVSGVALATAPDHTLYYFGTVHITALSNSNASIPDQDFILKKEILPAAGKFIETATMKNYQGVIQDLATSINVKGTTVTAKSEDGTAIGVGTIAGPEGDFTYLDIDFVIVPTGTRVKNINYITPTKLIARKEIRDSQGSPSALWETDMTQITEQEYQSRYTEMHTNH